MPDLADWKGKGAGRLKPALIDDRDVSPTEASSGNVAIETVAYLNLRAPFVDSIDVAGFVGCWHQ